MPSQLLIVGATARAAAQSAQRAGFEPLAVDRFADLDLRACCPAIQVQRFPQGVIEAAARFPTCPWIYTGALENHPDVISVLSRCRALLGNAAETVTAIRDPRNWSRVLRSEGLPCPEIADLVDRPSRGRWLRKPFRSAGGRAITAWPVDTPTPNRRAGQRALVNPLAAKLGTSTRDTVAFFLQQRIPGVSCSAVYIAARGRARMLGTTRQLIGCGWTGASGFAYAGSLAPFPLTNEQRRQFERIGDCLADKFPLEGLFGVDAIMNRHGVWTVEINPRYTASVEVLERVWDIPAVAWHVAACRAGRLPELPDHPPRTCCGKAVLFARRRLNVSDRFAAYAAKANAPGGPLRISDIPQPGTAFRPGQPLVSILIAGDTLTKVGQRLRQAARRVHRFLDSHV